MMHKLNIAFWKAAACLLVLAAAGMLVSATQAYWSPAGAVTADGLLASRKYPASALTLSGDWLACGPSLPPALAALCAGMPEGSIILGADPNSADPESWGGGSASINLSFPEVSGAAFAAAHIRWPAGSSQGLYSPEAGRLAQVMWAGDLVWNKATRDELVAGRYYAVKGSQVLVTGAMPAGETGPYPLRIVVPERTVWAIAAVEVNVYAQLDTGLDGNLRGIAYSPYRDCQTPDFGEQPSEENVREDMARMQHTSNALRTYSALGISEQTARIAGEYGLPVCAGAWLSREIDATGQPVVNRNQEELDALVKLANEVPLQCVIVGNEVLLRGDMSEARYIEHIRYVKSRIPASVPVSVAEVSDLVISHPKVAAEVDWLLIHIYPYWHGQPIEKGVDWVIAQYNAVRLRYPNHRVVIGETGWPSAGPARGSAVPSMANQRRFLTQFVTAADERKIDYYYFDAYDELWKREGGVGSHWGYIYSDRTGKHELQTLLPPAREISNLPTYVPVLRRAASLLNGLGDLLLRLLRLPAAKNAALIETDFWVFDDYVSEDNHFAASGWMGDTADLDYYECARDDPNSAETYIRVRYTPEGPKRWAGIYWQEPANNWGATPSSGYDLDEARALTFTARGENGGEKVRFFMGGLSGPQGDSQSTALSTDLVTLTDEWQSYSIDLRGRDLSRVIGGFGFSLTSCQASQPVTFYIDNIRYDVSGDPGAPPPVPPPSGPYAFPIYRDHDQPGNHFYPSGFMGDLGDASLDECYRANTHAGSTAIRVVYTAEMQGPSEGCGGAVPCGWSGVYWQDPANNWGSLPGGYDLRGAVGIRFWARGETGGERISFKAGGMNCGSVAYPETFCPAVAFSPNPITLTNTWQAYTLRIPVGTNLTKVMGPFVWSASALNNPGGAVFYLDDIEYLYNQEVP